MHGQDVCGRCIARRVSVNIPSSKPKHDLDERPLTSSSRGNTPPRSWRASHTRGARRGPPSASRTTPARAPSQTAQGGVRMRMKVRARNSATAWTRMRTRTGGGGSARGGRSGRAGRACGTSLSRARARARLARGARLGCGRAWCAMRDGE